MDVLCMCMSIEAALRKITRSTMPGYCNSISSSEFEIWHACNSGWTTISAAFMQVSSVFKMGSLPGHYLQASHELSADLHKWLVGD